MNSNEPKTIAMKLDGRSSKFLLGPLAGLQLARFVPHPPPVYIIDEQVSRKHPDWLEQIQQGCDSFPHCTLVLPGGEEIKSLAHLETIYRWLADCNVSRDGTVVGIGGGTILDLVGMAAATWKRGVNFVALPTTLLAMVDAALGGKTAINTAGLKNPVGVFHPASGILADCGFLSTLSLGAWRDGMAEMIKTALIGDPRLFAHLHHSREQLAALLGQGDAEQPVPGILGSLPWSEWISQAAYVKADVVNRDFREQGPRRALNLGHTLGHVLEAWSHESDEPLTHGAAVSIGMAVVFRIAAERGTCPLPTAVQVIELLEACGLPISYACPPTEKLTRLLESDKKASAQDGVRWVLPRKVGLMDLDGRVTADEIRKWLA
ncbi:MAG: 3-dehydroquinate synthase family protein [Candidatus Krumholzibacteria bacterium]|nr:3-dehydroquinate synthase family protein [Candidatus Krumholzibacteria bacterium]